MWLFPVHIWRKRYQYHIRLAWNNTWENFYFSIYRDIQLRFEPTMRSHITGHSGFTLGHRSTSKVVFTAIDKNLRLWTHMPHRITRQDLYWMSSISGCINRYAGSEHSRTKSKFFFFTDDNFMFKSLRVLQISLWPRAQLPSSSRIWPYQYWFWVYS